MNWKEFLKLERRKTYLWVVLSLIMLVTVFVKNVFISWPACTSYGYPLPFYSEGGIVIASKLKYLIILFNPFFWLNLVIMYVLSCLIIYFYKKIKR